MAPQVADPYSIRVQLYSYVRGKGACRTPYSILHTSGEYFTMCFQDRGSRIRTLDQSSSPGKTSAQQGPEHGSYRKRTLALDVPELTARLPRLPRLVPLLASSRLAFREEKPSRSATTSSNM